VSDFEDLDEHAGRLLAVANLLAEMAVQALRQGETEAARGLVDCVETLKVKTVGNLGPSERRVLDEVLTHLRLAVVKGPPPPDEPGPPGAASPGGAG
jgi:hypothetical protein